MRVSRAPYAGHLSADNWRWVAKRIPQRGRGRGQSYGFGSASAHKMHNLSAAIEKVVLYDSAITTPPDGLRTHDRALLVLTEFLQMQQALFKLFGQRIGIIMKTLVYPESINAWRHSF